MRRLCFVILAAACVTPLFAQAPRITPAGDPSVRNDTIYKLAVDPADHADDDYIYLLDDGVIRFEADGRSSRTYRQVIQIFTQEGAEDWGEQSFSYSGGSERLTINWIRVLKPSGQIISGQPAHEQESLAPVALEAPVYSDERVRRVTLSGVAPGTLVDWSYTVERIKPLVPGDYYTAWRVTTGLLTRRSRLIVDVPANVTPRIHEENVRFKRLESLTRGRHVYTWATGDIARIESEPLSAAPNSIYVHIDVGAPMTWPQMAQWYAQLSAGRYALSPDLEAQLSARVKSATTLEDSLRAVHRWVAQDFRYVSLSLGIGGYLPRLPAQVLESRYGDCKDKATLFIALARRMGVQAFPVLLSSSGSADSSMPTVQQFDHMIAAVDLPVGKGSGRMYLDLTSELTPYGELPPAEQGSFAIVVHDDGTGEEVRLPQAEPGANRSQVRIVGELTADGMFAGRYTESKTGSLQYGLRRAYARTFNQDEMGRLTQAMANGVFPGASGDSLSVFDGRDLRAAPVVTIRVRNAPVVSGSGTRVMSLPQSIPNFSSLALVSQLERHVPRRFPIDIGDVVGPIEIDAELRMTLPQGWKAQLPDGVTEESEFGNYSAEYAQEGRELRIVRRMRGNRGVASGEEVQKLIAWLRAISHDDVKFIVLEVPR
jgi:hypothetical protein